MPQFQLTTAHIPRRLAERHSRPLSAAVPAMAAGGGHMKTGVFAQETSGAPQW